MNPRINRYRVATLDADGETFYASASDDEYALSPEGAARQRLDRLANKPECADVTCLVTEINDMGQDIRVPKLMRFQRDGYERVPVSG